MVTLIKYLTRPIVPKEYDGEIYKHLWHCAMVEGVLYTLTALMF
jgi:hypothetical protein